LKGITLALRKLTGPADIPLSFDGGLPEIRIDAMRSLVIEPHRGLRSFAEESVLVETGGGLIHIRGKDIVMKRMTWRELRLQGAFSAVELVAEHAL
jgi:sporulation protein YqfC